MQQELEMVRRQTIQIESEKRALLRLLLLIVSLLLLVALALLGFTYRSYRQSSGVVRAAELKAEAAESKFQQCDRELQEKKAQLEQSAQTVAQQQERVEALKNRVLSQGVSQGEVAEFARLVYLSPRRSVEVPRLPPNALFQRIWRFRAPDQTQVYVLVGGQVDGKPVIYSNLIGTSAP
jgi:hypothetical protein